MSYIIEMLKALIGYFLTILYVFICILVILYEFIYSASKLLYQKLTRRIFKRG